MGVFSGPGDRDRSGTDTDGDRTGGDKVIDEKTAFNLTAGKCETAYRAYSDLLRFLKEVKE